jgi:DNA-binding response OmpR family regulator
MAPDQEQSPAEESKDRSVKMILVVEDDTDIGMFLVQAILQETRYQAMLVADGLQALNAIASIRPNLFILDYQLPSMNGIELFDHLQETQELQGTPAILISARLPRREIAKRNIIGMTKPLELDNFLQTIERLLT